MDEILIPIIAIVMTMSIPIAWFYFDNRNKEARYRAMERLAQGGQDPKMLERLLADEPTARRSNHRQPYRSGLICIAIGAAFLLATDHDGPPQWVGTLMFFIGLALLAGDFLNRRMAKREREEVLPPPRDPNQPL